MKSQSPDLSLKASARIAGFGLLFMFLAGLIGTGPKSSEAFDTYVNSIAKLRLNITGDVLVVVADVFAAFGLYYFLRPINRGLSLLAAWFRLAHVAIYGASMVNLFQLLHLLTDIQPDAVSTLALKQQGLMLLHGHEAGFLIGVFFFGFHIALLGYLVLRSTKMPKWLGYLLLCVSLGYMANSLAAFLIPTYPDFQLTMDLIVFVPAIIAELWLMGWLLFRGTKIQELK